MSGTTYHLIINETATNKRSERIGTVRDARKLALATKSDVDLRPLEGSPQAAEFGFFGGRVYYARGGGFRLHERVYGTFYTRGRLAKLLWGWRDTVGRVHFQSPIYFTSKR